MAEEDDDFDWHEFNAWMKQRHKEHIARNMSDYEKYVQKMIFLGFSEQPVGAGHRFTHPCGIRIDFWKQSGKWTIVGTNKYVQGPKKMIREARSIAEDWKGLHDKTPPPGNPEETIIRELRRPNTDTQPSKYIKYPEPRDDDIPPWED